MFHQQNEEAPYECKGETFDHQNSMKSVVSPRDLYRSYHSLERNNWDQDCERSRQSQHHSEGELFITKLFVFVIPLPTDLILVKFNHKPAHRFILVQETPHAKKQKNAQNQQIEVNIDQ